ncbi:hypothetical protein [Janthinobacterium lividum]|uniref:hypothetical protein n=1 Tax=Janthinobacterium lividum TaxID=29581 RepID=UPI00055239FA|nr:hypothetical protein [Janthinobacterium lividum]
MPFFIAGIIIVLRKLFAVIPVQKMKKKLIIISTVAACLFGSGAHADHRQDCDSADYARRYDDTFAAGMKNHVERLRQQQAGHQKNLDGMVAALKQSGAWSDDDSVAFFTNMWADERGKAVEADRKKASERWKIQVLAVQSWDATMNDHPAQKARGMCLLAPRVLDEAVVFYDALEKVWSYMETKVAAVAKDKNVSLPALP